MSDVIADAAADSWAAQRDRAPISPVTQFVRPGDVTTAGISGLG